GARVTVLDRDVERLRALHDRFGSRISTAVSTRTELEQTLTDADLVIGAVLLHGARAPPPSSPPSRSPDAPGSVLVDIAIDQGRLFRRFPPDYPRPPDFRGSQFNFLCGSHMPSVVPHTSTRALVNVTLRLSAPSRKRVGGRPCARTVPWPQV
ncbi:hypothetical protein GS876_21740, partial [Rhodococcus hoagii]|nr:hypothetical protein [Prescottella equi]